MWITIKINGQYYEARSNDLVELAEDLCVMAERFVSNIDLL